MTVAYSLEGIVAAGQKPLKKMTTKKPKKHTPGGDLAATATPGSLGAHRLFLVDNDGADLVIVNHTDGTTMTMQTGTDITTDQAMAIAAWMIAKHEGTL
jgi:hypothetical protein